MGPIILLYLIYSYPHEGVKINSEKDFLSFVLNQKIILSNRVKTRRSILSELH